MEDREKKISAIKSLLIDECSIPEKDIDVARNIFEGRNKLREKLYDLLLLDMVLPTRADQDPNEEDSPKFIDEIYSNPALKIPNQIVGETSHEDKFDELKEKFEDKLWSLVRYKENATDWQSKIKAKVFHLQKNVEQIKKSIMNTNHYDIGIICALREEYDAVIDVFGKANWKKHQDNSFVLPYHTCKVSTSMVGQEYSICAVCVGNAGMVQTSIYATAMYQIFSPECIFMTGFSAGLKEDKLSYGDIVIAKSVQDYSTGKVVDDPTGTLQLLREINQLTIQPQLAYAADELSSDQRLMSEINLVLREKNLLDNEKNVKAVVAPTVCGPFVVASETVVDNINGLDRKLQALDMEGFGLYSAARAMNKGCLWIKGIADFANSKKGDNYHKLASYASALFLYKLIKETLGSQA